MRHDACSNSAPWPRAIKSCSFRSAFDYSHALTILINPDAPMRHQKSPNRWGFVTRFWFRLSFTRKTAKKEGNLLTRLLHPIGGTVKKYPLRTCSRPYASCSQPASFHWPSKSRASALRRATCCSLSWRSSANVRMRRASRPPAR